MPFETYFKTGQFENDFGYNLNEASEPQYFSSKDEIETIKDAIDRSKATKDIINAVKKAGFKPFSLINISLKKSLTQGNEGELIFTEDENNHRSSGFVFKAYVEDAKTLKVKCVLSCYQQEFEGIDEIEEYAFRVYKLRKLAEFFENYDFAKSDIVIIQ